MGEPCHALVVAPFGRDAGILGALLDEMGITSRSCPDIACLESELSDDICFCVVTEESLQQTTNSIMLSWVAGQQSWSDLPFIVLTGREGHVDRVDVASTLSGMLGNVTFLERPFHPTTFVSVARSARKARLRQYEARARIEEAREAEQRLRTALLAGQLGTWELDLDAWTLQASVTCKAAFGRAAEDTFAYGDLVASILPADNAAMQAALLATAEKGGDWTGQYRTVWPEGSVHWVEIHARKVIVSHATEVGHRLVGVSRDITGAKTAQETLQRLNSNLEARVAERTAALESAHQKIVEEMVQRERAEDLLRQSQKMELIGQLTGGVAHDFNNLLMAILSNLDLLRKSVEGDARATRLIDGALQGATRGVSLTQRLLAFARRQDLTVEPVNVAKLVHGMTALIERSTTPRIKLSLNLPADLPRALVDANQLELALLNLVVNARDAMPEGGKLDISAEAAAIADSPDLRGGAYICVRVTDSGTGMDASTLAKATEPFFSTKEVGKGTGLGLSMVHGLARQLKGALRLHSELQKGTRAELWLPVTDQLERASTAPTEHFVPGQAANLTILVVDDDPLVGGSTAALLEDLGHSVIEAESGDRALQILRSGRAVDLIITDYSMPGMTGIELVAAARAIFPRLPVLLATGYAELPTDAQPGVRKLRKPYQRSQLIAEIAKAVVPSNMQRSDLR
ncbi:PAS/PAC sensor hybrid histidine kinase [Caballeronia glebae]|uniref:histidine kinase n=1 Tax=Caballeronia glebae TaxID=1777143 RepID=A0A158APD6_9BURK|nr:PAS domain-containing hybrid sensor histidine kinase/response regulator [Caballeronia glebae]SAK59851.1 PAS/PAC sensor hybrid histidine kinase [Caballeronia glebae]